MSNRSDLTANFKLLQKFQKESTNTLKQVNEKGELMVGDGTKAGYLDPSTGNKGWVLTRDEDEPLGVKWSNASNENKTYDYIVVGSGAGGSVVGARLALGLPNDTVLILEAGPNNSRASTNLTPNQRAIMDLPSFFPINWQRYHDDNNPDATIKFTTAPALLQITSLVDNYVNAYGPGDLREMTYPRGLGAGGSSALNACVAGRGSGTANDKFAVSLGSVMTHNKLLNSEVILWSYEDILPYYKKMERYYPDEDNLNDRGDPDFHSQNDDGWLSVRKHNKLQADLTGVLDDLNPVANIITDDLSRLMFEKFKTVHSAEFPNLNHPNPINDPSDPNTVLGIHVAEESVQGEEGTFIKPLAFPQEAARLTTFSVRSNAYEDLLQGVLDTQSNITMQFDTTVEQILWDKTGVRPKMIGVKAYNKEYLQNANITGNKIKDISHVYGVPAGSVYTAFTANKNLPEPTNYYARKEVILCAGFMHTPQILMLSGVGDKTELEAVGITSVSDVPTGKGVADHLETTVCYNMDPEKIIWQWQAAYLLAFNPTYKAQIIALAAGLSARVASTDDLNTEVVAELDTPFVYDATLGTLTGDLVGATLTIDGVDVALNNIVLLKNQEDGRQNGLWEVTTKTSGAAIVLTRALNYNNALVTDRIVTDSVIFVTEPLSSQANNSYRLTTTGSIVIGSASGSFLTYEHHTSAHAQSVYVNIITVMNAQFNRVAYPDVAHNALGTNLISLMWDDIFHGSTNQTVADDTGAWAAKTDWAVNTLNPNFKRPTNHVHFIKAFVIDFALDITKQIIHNLITQDLYDQDISDKSYICPDGNLASPATNTDTIASFNPETSLNNKYELFYSQFKPDKIQDPTKTNPRYNLVPSVFLSYLVENLPIMNPTGTIKLNSETPLDIRVKPDIRLNLTEDPDVMISMFNCITKCREATVNGAADAVSNCTASVTPADGVSTTETDLAYYLKPYGHSNYLASAEIFPGPNFTSEVLMTEYIRKWSSIGHHGGATARAGTNASNSVVNALCQVHGVDGVRVADTSIGNEDGYADYNTQEFAYFVGERVSDLIIDGITLPLEN